MPTPSQRHNFWQEMAANYTSPSFSLNLEDYAKLLLKREYLWGKESEPVSLEINNYYKTRQGEVVFVERAISTGFEVERVHITNTVVTQARYTVSRNGKLGNGEAPWDVLEKLENYERPKIDYSSPSYKWPEFTIGADPEMIFKYKLDFISANGIISCPRKYDFGDFGTDGCVYVAEWRPKQGNDPMDVVTNLQKCFIQACKNNPTLLDMKWCAGAVKGGYPIGGHIHFGMDKEQKMVEMLNRFLAAFYTLIEPYDEGFDRKNNRGYGTLGDCRDQPWGWEYRTLSSWIHSPAVSLAVLSVAKHIINQFKIEEKSKILNSSAVSDYMNERITEKFVTNDTKYFREKFDKYWPELRSWPTEPTLENGLVLFEDMISGGFTIKDGDVKKNWGITAYAA